MKYLVVAKKWDENKKAVVDYIVGEFNEYYLAELFKKAYNENYHANVKIYAK